MDKLRAILVCVDYSDILAITLPRNRNKFGDFVIVTSAADTATQELATRYDCTLHVTDIFYKNGAVFNKWAALEEGFDVLGRHGFICSMDADIVWPRSHWTQYECGYLYTPHRRMYPLVKHVPPEEAWWDYPRHHLINHWSGYAHIFHADDPVLAQRPWLETNWKHAGGGDTLFQQRWPRAKKVRPPFDVLHLGEAGVNWCGRVTPYVNGGLPQDAAQKKAMLDRFLAARARTKSYREERF